MSTPAYPLLGSAAVGVATELAGEADARVIRGLLDDAPDCGAELLVELIVTYQAHRHVGGQAALTLTGLQHARQAIGLEA